MMKRVGIKFREAADANDLVLEAGGSGGDVRSQKASCVCYNMCYSEGTDKEIIHIDRSNSDSCTCYNTNYNGPANPPRTATIKQVIAKRKVQKRFLALSRAILLSKDDEKTPEEKELEAEILDKTIKLLG
jgi:hypothetical protein